MEVMDSILTKKGISFTELKQPNNGKASILCEATRILRDLLAQIEDLRKENASLLSESHYVRPLKIFSESGYCHVQRCQVLLVGCVHTKIQDSYTHTHIGSVVLVVPKS